MNDETMRRIANETSKRVHRSICDTGKDTTAPNVDGSISAEETLGLIHGAVWGVAAFVAQSVVVVTVGEGKDQITPEEAMAAQVAEQFVHAFRAYRAAAGATIN